jgi:hypothetical protein
MTETEVWLSRTPTKLRGCRRTLRTVEIGLEGTYRNALARAQPLSGMTKSMSSLRTPAAPSLSGSQGATFA